MVEAVGDSGKLRGHYLGCSLPELRMLGSRKQGTSALGLKGN